MSSQADAPTVAVIVPTLNEAAHIKSCLQSLRNQTYPAGQMEIVVVDNGSTDKTCEFVAASGARLLLESRKSAYWARNLGIESTTSDWLAFTDADCIADPHWLQSLLTVAKKNDAMIVGGQIVYEMLEDTLGNRMLIETHQPEQVRMTIEQAHCVAGGNMFVRRTAFEQHGLFNVVPWGSDIEFSRRLHAAGHEIVFAANAIVRHQCDLSSWEYLRRTFETRYGQALLFESNRGWLPMLANMKKMPWRPGFRSGKSTISDQSWTPVSPVKDWMYRWINRWMGFAGEQYGLCGKRAKPPTSS